MAKPVEYGSGSAKWTLEGAGKYLVATDPVPWDTWARDIKNGPQKTVYVRNLEQDRLESLLAEVDEKYDFIVGFGGGAACDTAKYIAWKIGVPLITIPSIVSTDAFLCPAIGVRNQDRVRYVSGVKPEKIIVDFELIRRAPPGLNYGGVGDSISCASALGDWRIGQAEYGENLDEGIFKETAGMVKDMLQSAGEIHSLSNQGIRWMVTYLLWEVELSERFGNARPEEGGEHFLAYALEKIRPRRYLHGSLIALNVLIVLRLQGPDAVFSVDEVKRFLDEVGVEYSLGHLGVRREDYRQALETVPKYVEDEGLFKGVFSRQDPFAQVSIDSLMEWIGGFR